VVAAAGSQWRRPLDPGVGDGGGSGGILAWATAAAGSRRAGDNGDG